MIEQIQIKSREHGLALRRPNVGASELGALWNRHKWTSKLRLWLDKRGELPAQANPDTAMMMRGRVFEPAVARAVELKYGWKLTPSDTYYQDKELRFGCTPDYLNEAEEPVEVKIVLPDQFELEWQGGKAPPFYYQMQCHAQRRFVQSDRSYLAALIPNTYGFDLERDLHVYQLPKDANVDADIDQALVAFWGSVERNIRPDVYAQSDNALMAATHPEIRNPVKTLLGDVALQEAFAARELLKARIKEDSARLDVAEARIKDTIGDAAGVITSGWSATWPTQNRKAYDVKATSFRTLKVSRS